MPNLEDVEVAVNEAASGEALEVFLGCIIMAERELAICDAASSQQQAEHESLQGHTSA
jgi:hypothetical protein